LLIGIFIKPFRCVFEYRLNEVSLLFISSLIAAAAFLLFRLKKEPPPYLVERISGFALGLTIPLFLVYLVLLFVPAISEKDCEWLIQPLTLTPTTTPTVVLTSPETLPPTSEVNAPVSVCTRLAPLPDTIPYFNIYTDANAPDNHFSPTVYMGDVGDITVIEDSTDYVHSGSTSIKITYDAKGRGSGMGEYRCRLGEITEGPCKNAGVYWVNPPDNIGNVRDGGYNLTGFKKLTFWALSPEGIDVEFQVGGVGVNLPKRPDCPDSYVARARPPLQALEPKWNQYEVLLEEPADLSYIIGGFYWDANWPNNGVTADNPKKLVFYLDDIRFER